MSKPTVYVETTVIGHLATRLQPDLVGRICEDSGYIPPTICSPDELLGT